MLIYALCVCVIGAQQVIPMSVLPQADQPRHAVGDSQRMVTIATTTVSSSVPATSVAASTNMPGMEKVIVCVVVSVDVCVDVCIWCKIISGVNKLILQYL